MNNHYLHQTEQWMNEGKCPEKIVRQMNALIDREVMQPLLETSPQKYWDLMRNMHAMCEGCHYNEKFALWEVEQMHHKESNGTIHKGAHWTMDSVQQVYTKYKTTLPAKTTVYDVYVALNSFYHDMVNCFKEDFGDNWENYLIKHAIKFYFKDDDAPEGKIWHYYQGMRK